MIAAVVVGLGLFIFFVAVPGMQARAAVHAQIASPTSDIHKLVRNLGGQCAAARKLQLYMRWPGINTKEMNSATCLLGACGEYGVAPLLALLNSPMDDDVWGATRGVAALALGRIGDKSVIPRLLPLLHDREWAVRAATIMALGNLQAVSAVEKLERIAQEDTVGLVGEAAREALDKIKKAQEERKKAEKQPVEAPANQL
jgi:HEAT repeat protein